MPPANFLVRLFITLFTYCILYNFQSISILFIIILLILLDWLDGINPFIKYNKIINYDKYDKINDSIAYLLLLPLMYKLVTPQMFRVLMLTTLYRLIGIINYINSENKDFFILYPDLFKELLLIEFISNKYTIIDKYKLETIISMILLKINFEYIHHKTKITKDLANLLNSIY
jgi:hypothetical protein